MFRHRPSLCRRIAARASPLLRQNRKSSLGSEPQTNGSSLRPVAAGTSSRTRRNSLLISMTAVAIWRAKVVTSKLLLPYESSATVSSLAL